MTNEVELYDSIFRLPHQLKLLTNSGIAGHSVASPLDRKVASKLKRTVDGS